MCLRCRHFKNDRVIFEHYYMIKTLFNFITFFFCLFFFFFFFLLFLIISDKSRDRSALCLDCLLGPKW